MKLRGKVAFVTGAGSGIGRASSILFAREGAKVAVVGNKPAEINRTVEMIKKKKGQAVAVLADISQPHEIRSAVEETVKKWKRIDIVFANAGINGVWAPIDELDVEDWDRTIQVNLRGTFLTLKYTVPHLKKRGGSAMITSSCQGTSIFNVAGSTAYACTKGAQIVLAKKLASELIRNKVRVNAICPGSVYTNINDSVVRKNVEKIKPPVIFPEGNSPLHGRKADPEDIARLALFLASDESRFITGTQIWIDGGWSLLSG